jgi:PAS domain-containing protein
MQRNTTTTGTAATQDWQRDDAIFRRLVDGVPDYAIFLLDADGYVRTWNAGAQEITGYEENEILGRHFSVFYPPEMIDRRWPTTNSASPARPGASRTKAGASARTARASGRTWSSPASSTTTAR